MLVSGLLGCTTDAEPTAAGEESTDDARDLGLPPTPAAILDPERGDPPATLQVEDLVPGEGPAVVAGDELLVEYLGLRWSDGQEFSSSWAAGDPLRFELGSGRVIPGWEQGILGAGTDSAPLRVGGRRVLTIPPDLAYGERGSGSAVPPGETLVFVIDLVAVDDI